MSFTAEDIRAHLGDVDEDLLSEDALELLLDEGGLYFACARGAEIIAQKYARRADKALGDQRINYNESASMWLDIADRFRTKASKTTAPIVGGISAADVRRRKAHGDRPQSDFERGMLGDDT